MAKKKSEVTVTEDTPYIEETPKTKRSFKEAATSRPAKIGAIVAGSTLALGAAFGIGLTAGHAQGPAFGHGQMGQGHFGDRDGDRDHRDGGKQGGHPGDRDGGMRGGHPGDRDGGKVNPNQAPKPLDPSAPAPQVPNAPQP